MAAIQADHWRWMTFTWENLILKAPQQSRQQLFVGICRYWEKSLADSRLDFTEKSPQRTEVALEFVQSSISAIWSQPSDSDYEHTPNGCFSFMGLCFRAALCFIQRLKQPCLQYFSSESEKWHEAFSFLHLVKLSHWDYLLYSTKGEILSLHSVCQILMFVEIHISQNWQLPWFTSLKCIKPWMDCKHIQELHISILHKGYTLSVTMSSIQ